MGRASCCDKVGMKKGRWTSEEDEILAKYIKTHGEGSWRSLPKNSGLKRCGKSCRLRWINYLRADVKRGNISPEEEDIIIELQATLGNRWSLIAGHLPGRTDNEIKNYWNSHLSRRIHTFRKFSDGVPVIVDLGKLAVSCKRRGGRTSRSTMKRNSFPTLTTNLQKLMNNNINSFYSPLASIQKNIVREGYPNDSSTAGGVSKVNLALLDAVLSTDFTGSSNQLVLDDNINNSNCLWGSKEMEDLLLSSTTTTTTTTTTTSNQEMASIGTMSCVDQNYAETNSEEATREKLLEEGCRDDLVELSKMWYDDEQIWPWLWVNDNHNSNGSLEVGGVEGFNNIGYQEEFLDTWLL